MKNETMHRAVLLLGSNLGDRFQHLQAAVRAMAKNAGSIAQVSAVYETQPWGVTGQPNYLNAALILHTSLQPQLLLDTLKTIEQQEGRTDRKKYAPRTLDIDILFYDDLVFNSKELTIPHPKLHLRKFALIPLAEVEARFVHPALKKSIGQLLSECTDPLEVCEYAPLNF
jgi:2-amino-4-hydroxy-6-hydroxymethyldihydropteridine diphosphokinase